MDYQMFLVSGMREAWAHGEDARTVVRWGFSHGARVITAAALIMTGVFAGFMHSQMTKLAGHLKQAQKPAAKPHRTPAPGAALPDPA
jgi:uncharacterized membrane protein YdfJ with MMPL/SSD domain